MVQKIDMRDYKKVALYSANIIIEDNIYCASIPSCPGVWATGETRDIVMGALEESLEEWLQQRLARGWDVPEFSVSLAANQ